MNKIKILPDSLANQIAAGEVVERPASVVKELVENSIDAGARRIQIDIELGGRRLVRISDNGEGMSRDDAILAFERHATSKIKTAEDLAAIETLGFRGEALASIASVAKVELVTKTENETAATRVIIEGGRLIDVKDAARDTGTTFSVRDLFFNTPARRKFMRSEATENYHLTSVVQHYALAYPEIAFILTNNGREILRLSSARDLRERAYQIFGGNLLESLLPVAGGRDFLAKVSGFVSAPRERRTTRDAQYFFVNKRFVRDRVIAGGLLEGYRSVLPHGVYPVAFLFLEVPLEEVDVNVHPAKTEVRFRRSEAIKEMVAEAVREGLAGAGILRLSEERHKFSFSDEKVSEEKTIAEQTEITFSNFREGESTSRVDALFSVQKSSVSGSESQPETEPAKPSESDFQSEVFSSDFEEKAVQYVSQEAEFESPKPESAAILSDGKRFDETQQQAKSAFGNYGVLPPVDSAAKIIKTAEIAELKASKIRPVGQLHESFIIAVDDEGLLLIDQHVAHERILFDKFRRKEGERKIESQNLLLPETFDLTPAQAAAFGAVEEDLEKCGFGLMRLSGRTIAIKSIPTDLPPSEARNLLAEILDTVDAEKRGAAKANLRDEIAASLACKAAVKINTKLTTEKMQWLIDRLLITSSPTTCPHGRPVILRLTMKDIERKFHRT
jgi:DNA mismatch repair protein MutL